jgi:hypothetical protein
MGKKGKTLNIYARIPKSVIFCEKKENGHNNLNKFK